MKVKELRQLRNIDEGNSTMEVEIEAYLLLMRRVDARPVK